MQVKVLRSLKKALRPRMTNPQLQWEGTNVTMISGTVPMSLLSVGVGSFNRYTTALPQEMFMNEQYAVFAFLPNHKGDTSFPASRVTLTGQLVNNTYTESFSFREIEAVESEYPTNLCLLKSVSFSCVCR